MSRSTSTLTARSETGSVTRIAATLNLEERVSLRPTSNIRRPRTANHPWPVTDGIKHPVTRRFKEPVNPVGEIASPNR